MSKFFREFLANRANEQSTWQGLMFFAILFGNWMGLSNEWLYVIAGGMGLTATFAPDKLIIGDSQRSLILSNEGSKPLVDLSGLPNTQESAQALKNLGAAVMEKETNGKKNT